MIGVGADVKVFSLVEQIGVAAPVLLVVLRFLQGIGGSSEKLSANAPERHSSAVQRWTRRGRLRS
jgi:hypothetical protein